MQASQQAQRAGTHRGRSAAARRGQKKSDRLEAVPPRCMLHIPAAVGTEGPPALLSPPAWQRLGPLRPALGSRAGMWRRSAVPARQQAPYLRRQLRDPTGHIIKELSLLHLRGSDSVIKEGGSTSPTGAAASGETAAPQ